MAFLSHSIPWHGLASLFEFRAARSGPGLQDADIFPICKPSKVKQLEHFARRLRDVAREHSTVERRRHGSAESYMARATKWMSTDSALEAIPIEQDWSTSRETRSVFPMDFATLYIPFVPITSGGPYGRKGIVEDFTRIETWTDFTLRRRRISTATEEERNKLWLDERTCSDIIRLMFVDAATTQDDNRWRDMIGTLFRLVHHPEVGLHAFMHLSMWCCNINVGIEALFEKTLSVFIHLNLLQALISTSSSSELLAMCETSLLDSASQPRAFANVVPLNTRPAYMATRSFKTLLSSIFTDKCHGNEVDVAFLRQVFAQRKHSHASDDDDDDAGEEKLHERDIFSETAQLRAALKSMWKVLIYLDMVLRDASLKINWEFAVIKAIDLWTWRASLLDEPFFDYADRRRETEDFNLFYS